MHIRTYIFIDACYMHVLTNIDIFIYLCIHIFTSIYTITGRSGYNRNSSIYIHPYVYIHPYTYLYPIAERTGYYRDSSKMGAAWRCEIQRIN